MTGDRQGRLWFIEQVEAGSVEASDRQFQERLTVRAVVQIGEHARDAGARIAVVGDVRGHAIEGLGAKEPTPARPMIPFEEEMRVEGAMRVMRREMQVAASTFGIEPRRDREGLDDGRLPRSVVPDEGGHGGELDVAQPAYRGEVERVSPARSGVGKARPSQERQIGIRSRCSGDGTSTSHARPPINGT